MKQYQDLLKRILETGIRQPNRTGIDTLMIPGAMFQHDMAEGFPALTTKKLHYAGVIGELCGFMRGYTNNEQFKALGCNVWTANAEAPTWLNSSYSGVAGDMGRIYSAQWRNYRGVDGQGKIIYVDQLADAINEIGNNPTSRRIIVNAWNPAEIKQACLPPCHTGFQFLCDTANDRLHLCWNQRSCDFGLGIPYNVASYATLLTLVAHATGYTPGILTGLLADCHIYVNHIEQLELQLTREPYTLPALDFPIKPEGVYPLEYLETIKPETVSLVDYQCHPALKMQMAV